MTHDEVVRRPVLPYVVLVVLAALPPVALELVHVFGDHSVPPGRCEGIGWGCTLSPADSAAFLLLFVLPVTLVWLLIAVPALALLRRRAGYRALPSVVQGVLPMIPLYVVAAAVLLL